jgi:hypothetical protein
MEKTTVLVLGAMLAGCGVPVGTPEHESLLSGPATMYPATRFNYLVYADDVTGDGKVDLFVSAQALERPAVSVLAGYGDGHFAAPLIFDVGAPTEMVSGDFQGDGAPDIVGINNDGHGALSMFLLKGDGSGGFTQSLLTPSQRYWSGSIGTADFTGDGLPDVVAPYQDDDPTAPGGIAIRAAPDFSIVEDVPVAAFEFGTFVAVGDFDGDGHADVVVTTTPGPTATNAGQIALLLGDGAGHLGAPTFFPAVKTNTRPVVADFDGDGALDVALVDSSNIPDTERIAILLNDGSGGFKKPKSYATGLSSQLGAIGLAAGDFDDDGLLDLVVGSGGPHITVMHGDGKGKFRACDHLALAGGEAWSVASGDFDGNGRSDVAATTTLTDVAVFLNL